MVDALAKRGDEGRTRLR